MTRCGDEESCPKTLAVVEDVFPVQWRNRKGVEEGAYHAHGQACSANCGVTYPSTARRTARQRPGQMRTPDTETMAPNFSVNFLEFTSRVGEEKGTLKTKVVKRKRTSPRGQITYSLHTPLHSQVRYGEESLNKGDDEACSKEDRKQRPNLAECNDLDVGEGDRQDDYRHDVRQDFRSWWA